MRIRHRDLSVIDEPDEGEGSAAYRVESRRWGYASRQGSAATGAAGKGSTWRIPYHNRLSQKVSVF